VKKIKMENTNLQVWCKKTDLATILLWYRGQDILPRSKSQLGRLIVEDFARMIEESGAETVKDTQVALEVLRGAGLEDPVPPGAKRQLLELKQRTSYGEDELKQAAEEAMKMLQGAVAPTTMKKSSQSVKDATMKKSS
jgi:hypothetical protein